MYICKRFVYLFIYIGVCVVLDKKSQRVLDILSTHSNGEYKVLEVVDIQSKLPKKATMTLDELHNVFMYLKDTAYIDIKYIDDSELCFAILPKYRVYAENLETEKKMNKKLLLILVLSGIISGVSSFLGAFISQLIG